MAVEQNQAHVGIGAADGDFFGFIVIGAHRHTGQALQGVGEIFVRHLADILGGDDFDVGAGIAFDIERFFEGSANAGDNNRFGLGGLGFFGGFGFLLGSRCGRGSLGEDR